MPGDPWNPGKLLEVSGAYWQSCALHAAVKLDVFTHLSDGPLDAAQVARRADAEPRAVAMLLNAMAAMGLLEKAGDVYANTETAARFLVREAPGYLGYMILHHHHLAPSWSQLDQAVRAGGPVRARASFGDPEVREAFLMGMFNNAMLLAPSVVAAVDLAGRRRLLDLGGGPGTYAIHFCQANPELRATVFDLDDTGDGPLYPALFSLNMLLGTEGGQSYTDGEIRRMLAVAGGRDIRRLASRGPTESGIICATV
jgi:hypothetical protein